MVYGILDGFILLFSAKLILWLHYCFVSIKAIQIVSISVPMYWALDYSCYYYASQWNEILAFLLFYVNYWEYFLNFKFKTCYLLFLAFNGQLNNLLRCTNVLDTLISFYCPSQCTEVGQYICCFYSGEKYYMLFNLNPLSMRCFLFYPLIEGCMGWRPCYQIICLQDLWNIILFCRRVHGMRHHVIGKWSQDVDFTRIISKRLLCSYAGVWTPLTV